MLPSKQFFQNYVKENNLPWSESNIFVEYLQTQVLKIISTSPFATRLSFMGGTCLRILYKIDRFSEDLDFDLVDKKFDLEKAGSYLKQALKNLNLAPEIKIKTTQNIHIIFLKFDKKALGYEISTRKEAILIKIEIDFSPSKFIQSETKFVDDFNERFPLIINTKETIFAQKILAFFLRPYIKGRDMYDLIWFLSQKNLEPNYKILEEKGIKVKNRAELIDKLLEKATKIDFNFATKDVERFLFNPKGAEWVRNFEKYLNGFNG